MASQPTLSPCCLKSFTWDGTPTGHETTLSSNRTYVVGSNPHAAVLFIHDALGWTFTNARLLADHFAREANTTVFLPDFFAGEELDKQSILENRWQDLDLASFQSRNSRAIREPEIFACAKALRSLGYHKIGAVGYCYGGWAVLRLSSPQPLLNKPLVDAVVCAHPSWLTKEDIDGVSTPIMFLAPERDTQFSLEMKRYAFEKLVLGGVGRGKGVPVEWVHFPGVEHGCLTKGDERVEGEREALVRGKDAVVGWFREYLAR